VIAALAILDSRRPSALEAWRYSIISDEDARDRLATRRRTPSAGGGRRGRELWLDARHFQPAAERLRFRVRRNRFSMR
jgi:hypothetical protein